MADPTAIQRTAFDPNTKKSASFYDAVASQVRADFKLDQLNELHDSGRLNDKNYIKDLQDLTKQYREGTGIQRELQSSVVGAAQTIAGNYQTQINEDQQAFRDEALAAFNQATTDYASGLITEAEYTQQKNLYNEALKGERPIPTVSKTTNQVLGGKFWDRYKSGRVRNIMREKQIKGLYKEINGQKIGKKQLNKLAGSEGTKSYIREKLITDKGVERDLKKEQEALPNLIKTLGRMPTPQEMSNFVYG